MQPYFFEDAPSLSREEAASGGAAARLPAVSFTEALRPFLRGEKAEARPLPPPCPALGEAPFSFRLRVIDLKRGGDARVVLDPRLARRLIRLILGAEEDPEVARPLSPAEEGLLHAAALCALGAIPGGEGLALATDEGPPAGAVWVAFSVTLGEAQGWAGLALRPSLLRPRAGGAGPRWAASIVGVGRVVVGRAALTAEERRDLRPGDIVVPDALALDEQGRGQARLSIAGLGAEVKLDGGRAVLLGGMMAEAKPGPQVEVTVELGRVNARLEELSGWGPGTVLPLVRRPGDPVELVCDGRVVARGEVVRVEGELGVRLLWVAE